MDKYQEKASAPAKPSGSGKNTAGPRGSNPPSETMGGKGSAYRAKSFGVSPGAPPHSNQAAAKAEAMQPSGYGSAGGPPEVDVDEAHGNHLEFLADLRENKEV
jgi:hypothetical protein